MIWFALGLLIVVPAFMFVGGLIWLAHKEAR